MPPPRRSRASSSAVSGSVVVPSPHLSGSAALPFSLDAELGIFGAHLFDAALVLYGSHGGEDGGDVKTGRHSVSPYISGCSLRPSFACCRCHLQVRLAVDDVCKVPATAHQIACTANGTLTSYNKRAIRVSRFASCFRSEVSCRTGPLSSQERSCVT